MEKARLAKGRGMQLRGVDELLIDTLVRAYKNDPRFIAFAQKIGVMPKALPSSERRKSPP